MSGMRLSMRVWDLPVRLFHALVALLLIAAAVTAHLHHPLWHIRIGEALLIALVWRLIWGFVGSETARLAAFAVNPLAALRRPGETIGYGHAASGGWLVWLMLALIAAVLATGFIPAARPAHAPLFWALIALIVLHIALVIAAGRTTTRQRRNDPPAWQSIITGKQRMPVAMRAPKMASLALAALVAFCAAGAVILLLNQFAR
jgi:cytochrome b